ncbi:MAG: hypothetical protein EOO99_10390 [Pedobacter sp.]|nr:MAG: hypothetical protein EOO99_10390 [Pedobacter sp.]
MIVTVVPIFEYEIQPSQPLQKVMSTRLKNIAETLENEHLSFLNHIEPLNADIVIYISYNSKYTVRWQIVNDVPAEIESQVRAVCGGLNYLPWKVSTTAFLGLKGNSI